MEEERTQSDQLSARVVLKERSPWRCAAAIGTPSAGRPSRDPPRERLSARAFDLLSRAVIADGPINNHALNITVSMRRRSASSRPDRSDPSAILEPCPET